MTTDTQDHYAFIDKPPFPIIGKMYPDSIDWIKNRVDPYSLARRHTDSNKMQNHSDKVRKPKLDSTFNTKL